MDDDRCEDQEESGAQVMVEVFATDAASATRTGGRTCVLGKREREVEMGLKRTKKKRKGKRTKGKRNKSSWSKDATRGSWPYY